MGPLKAESRIVVKMQAYDCTLGAPSPSRIYDAVRCTVVCGTAAQMLDVLQALDVGDGSMRVVRLKNHVRDLDETHYRRLQCVVMVAVGVCSGFYHLAEVQIQLAPIYAYRNAHMNICRKPTSTSVPSSRVGHLHQRLASGCR